MKLARQRHGDADARTHHHLMTVDTVRRAEDIDQPARERGYLYRLGIFTDRHDSELVAAGPRDGVGRHQRGGGIRTAIHKPFAGRCTDSHTVPSTLTGLYQ